MPKGVGITMTPRTLAPLQAGQTPVKPHKLLSRCGRGCEDGRDPRVRKAHPLYSTYPIYIGYRGAGAGTVLVKRRAGAFFCRGGHGL